MADTSIGKAYVQIVPQAKGISKDIESAIGGDVSKSGDSAGKSFASQMIGAIKGVAILLVMFGHVFVHNHMEDPYAPVESGTRGTVKHVDDAGQLHMQWDVDLIFRRSCRF